ncbi:MAG: FkbM family methyltransferase [Patescibacteria group bacterium]|jgi:FkbM family methyltransferase
MEINFKKNFNLIVFYHLRNLFEQIKIIKLIRNVRYNKEKIKKLQFFSSFMKEKDLVFDVGANVGIYSEFFLGLKTKVVAIEPQVKCVKYLEYLFKNNKNVAIENVALGKNEETGEILISRTNDGHSSMSNDFISSIKKSNRFSNDTYYFFDRKQEVKIATLDSLIKKYGIPKFIKIDVEGFEYNVLQGLTQPIKALSFEFFPDFFDPTKKCIQHLEKLNNYRFNYSLRDFYQLELPKYVTGTELIKIISNFSEKNIYGEIYCRIEK